MREQLEMVRRFIKSRPSLETHNSNPHNMIALLRMEVDELEHALREETPEAAALELVDCAFFVLSMAVLLNIPLEELFAQKASANEQKYQADLFQGDLSYEQARALVRERWKQLNPNAVAPQQPCQS
jgi:NTP pyrophosphatase (non-canonical NTP hydrolase)